MLISEMTMSEFSDGLGTTRSLLIPFGSTEEHGQHLPLDTDTMQAYRVGTLLAQRRPIFIAPPVHYGVCRSTREHPGTISIRTETLKALTLDLVSSFYHQGMRNIILLSGHAGGTHMASLTDAGEQLLEMHTELQIAVVTEYMLAAEKGRHLIETKGDSHAGEIETSRILHSHPELVKGTSPSEFPGFPPGLLVRNKQKYWPGGVWGDPGKASAEKGRQIEELVVDALVDLVQQMENWKDREI